MNINQDFIKLSEKYKILFDELISTNNLEKFLLEQKNLIKILDSLYPEDLSLFIEKHEINKDIKIWNDFSAKFISEIDSFKINQESIIVNKDGYPEIFPVFDLVYWIENKVKKDSYEFYIILALLSKEEIYENFQIFQMIKNN